MAGNRCQAVTDSKHQYAKSGIKRCEEQDSDKCPDKKNDCPFAVNLLGLSKL